MSVIDQSGAAARLLTREAFERQRASAKRTERRHSRRLAFLSVGLGVAQLIFLRWADVHLDREPRVAIAGTAFLLYVALIGALLWRMEREVRAARPACPQCGVALRRMSERIAAAIGRCDACGGQIIA